MFDHFMNGYWNEISVDSASSPVAAVDEFISKEGEFRARELLVELESLIAIDMFLETYDHKNNPLKDYHYHTMILVEDAIMMKERIEYVLNKN